MSDERQPLEERTQMRPQNYRVMFEVEDDHWWFVGRRAIVFTQIDRLLPIGGKAEILDIGCGTGATMDALKSYGRVQGIDLSMLPLSFSRQRGHERVLCASATSLPFPDRHFDLVTALDVIEHLEDDIGGVREIFRILKPGARAVFFVPAFQSLWGPNDDQSGHQRRYRRRQFREVVESAGLIVERISYANFCMFLPIWLGRRILSLLGRHEQSENRINHRLLNRLLASLFSAEAGWLKRHQLPFGVSLLCVARKMHTKDAEDSH
ncbi:MAG: class I SAM-dependent methyltransferase [Blastocatellia bacterium]|jgi:SAM-dependent methyltransferase